MINDLFHIMIFELFGKGHCVCWKCSSYSHSHQDFIQDGQLWLEVASSEKKHACTLPWLIAYFMHALCRIRRYAENVKRSSKEVREMYQGDASQSSLENNHACMSTVYFGGQCCSTIHASIHIHAYIFFNSWGAELKNMFLQSGGNFDIVEAKVKNWFESKKTTSDTEARVTKRQLKEKYFWDDVKNLDNVLCTHACIK